MGVHGDAWGCMRVHKDAWGWTVGRLATGLGCELHIEEGVRKSRGIHSHQVVPRVRVGQ